MLVMHTAISSDRLNKNYKLWRETYIYITPYETRPKTLTSVSLKIYKVSPDKQANTQSSYQIMTTVDQTDNLYEN